MFRSTNTRTISQITKKARESAAGRRVTDNGSHRHEVVRFHQEVIWASHHFRLVIWRHRNVSCRHDRQVPTADAESWRGCYGHVRLRLEVGSDGPPADPPDWGKILSVRHYLAP